MTFSKHVHDQLTEAVRVGRLEEIQYELRSNGLSRCDGYGLLQIAAKNGKTGIAQLLLSNGCEVNCRETNSNTPLHFSAWTNNITLIKALLKSGAQVDSQDRTGCTALHLALKHGNISIVILLLNHGASVDIVDNNNFSPLHYAVIKNVNLVSILLKYGASIHIKCNGNNTALHLAARSGNLKVVKFLIAEGVQLNVFNDKNETPLNMALESGGEETAQLLIESGASFTYKNSIGESVLLLAIRKNYNHIVSLILSYNVDVNSTTISNVAPLHVAAANRNQTVCALLLKLGANVNISNHDGKTPLLLAVLREDWEISKLLLENGAEVNIKTKCNLSPLFVAARSRNEKLFQMLLQHKAEKWDDSLRYQTEIIFQCALNEGIFCIAEYILNNFTLKLQNLKNVNVFLKNALLGFVENSDDILKVLVDAGLSFSDEFVNDPEIVSVVIKDGHKELFEGLLREGLDVNSLLEFDLNGSMRYYSLLNFAISHGQKNIARLLLHHGAIIDIIDGSNCSPLFMAVEHAYQSFNMNENLMFIELILRKGAHVDGRNCEGLTPLLTALSKDFVHHNVVKTLLAFNANVNCEDGEGRTPLHLTSKEKVVEMLLEKGAFVDHKNAAGQTPLHSAVFRSDFNIVKLLLRYRANPNIRDSDGMTALHLSSKDYISEILLKHGAKVDLRNDLGQTSLHLAVFRLDLKTVKLLSEFGATVDIKDKFGKTPLSLSLEERRLLNTDIATLLIKNGAKINEKCELGTTPIQQAVLSGNLKIIELLLLCDADVYCKDNENRSALHLAFIHNEDKIFKVLLENSWEAAGVSTKFKHLYELVMFINENQTTIIDDSKIRMLEMLHQHIIKLEAGLSQKKTLNVKDEVFLDFQENCEVEVATMKSEFIGGLSVSYHDILSGSSERIVEFLEHDSFRKMIKGKVFLTKKFPIYSGILSFKVKRAKNRRNLLSQLKTTLFFDVFPYLPALCVEKIFSYLCNRDLEVLVFVLNRMDEEKHSVERELVVENMMSKDKKFKGCKQIIFVNKC